MFRHPPTGGRSMALFTKQEALDYHSKGRKGKIEVIPVKPCRTQKQLSMAYSPGVAHACLEIAADPAKSFEYTARGNLVAVVSNGTAVLGWAYIGAAAGKPVMEGKGVCSSALPTSMSTTSTRHHRPRRTHRRREDDGAHLRRHQPRRYQGPRVLLHRGAAQEADEHPVFHATTSTARPSSPARASSTPGNLPARRSRT